MRRRMAEPHLLLALEYWHARQTVVRWRSVLSRIQEFQPIPAMERYNPNGRPCCLMSSTIPAARPAGTLGIDT